MGTEVCRKDVRVSNQFYDSIEQVTDYGVETFGVLQAERYKRKIQGTLDMLPVFYTAHPECRHLRTKSRMYRNVILDSHLIIYRITEVRIEVLDIVHSASSVRRIQRVRRIRI